jgi:hypothetical protein
MAGLVTGRGTTLGFGSTTTWTPKYVSFSGFGAQRPSIDTSYLGTTGARTKIGGDLYEISPMTAPFFLEPDELATGGLCSLDDILFDSGNASAAETMTLTLADAGAATMAATGHVVGVDIQEIVIDQLVMAELTVQFNDWPTIAE